MDTFDFEKEFSEWVVIREQATPSFSPPNAEESPLVSSPPVRSPVPLRDQAGPSGDVIFSLPDHIVLSVLRYSATDPYALYRYVFLTSLFRVINITPSPYILHAIAHWLCLICMIECARDQ